MKLRLTLFNFFAVTGLAFGQAQQTNTFGRNIDTPAERQSFREALELWTDDSPTFLNGTYTGDLTVDTNTLHVDSANNRVGVGTNTPSAGYALDVSGNTKITGYLDLDRTVDIYLGELPSSPAFSGLWFSKNSSTATASNYSFLGDSSNTFLNGPTNLYLRTGNTTRATIDADGIEVAAGDSISFTSNSGLWDGAALKVDTIDETTANFEPLLDLSTGYLGRFGPHQVNFKNGTLDSYNGTVFTPALDYNNHILYTYNGDQVLNWSNGFEIGSGQSIYFADNSGSWNGSLFSGDQSFTGNVGVTGVLTTTGGVDLDGSSYLIRRPAGSPLGAEHAWTNTVFSFDHMEFDLLNKDTYFNDRSFRINQALGFDYNSRFIWQDLSCDLYLGQATGTGGKLHLRDGSSHDAEILSAPLAANRNYTLPDVGADADFVMTAGSQTITGDKTFDGNLILNQGTAGGTTGQLRIVDDYGSQIIGAQNAGEFAFYIDNDASGTETAGDVPLLGFSYGGQSLYLGGSSISSPTVQVGNGAISLQGTPIISGNFSASGQVELTGQAASTDDSAMTRSLVDEWGLDNIGRIFNLTLADLSLASSGTGAGATSSPNGIRLYSGTSTSGYARATLMNGTGGWTYSTPFQRPMAAAFSITFSPASVTDTGSGIRIGFGISTTAPWDSDGLTGAGFGFEYEPDGTNHRIRAIAHDGTTFTAGSWVNIGTGSTYAGHRGLLIESDGAGNISVTITEAYGDTSTTYTATTTGGPTTTASGVQSSIHAVACNESTGTPALIGCDIKAARVRLD